MCVDASQVGLALLAPLGLGAYAADEAKAKAERANADAVRAAGYTNESITRNKDRRQMATQLATLSARGLALDTGSPLALQAESARNSELDALQVRANAGNQAQVHEFGAKQAMFMAPFDVANQLMATASKAATLGAV